MDKSQYDAYQRSWSSASSISVNDLDGQSRTLVYGYNVDRETVHVWLDGGYIWRSIGAGREYVVDFRESWPAEGLRPSKRAYPERTDYEFARLMRDRDADLSFTTFNQDALDEALAKGGQFFASTTD